MKKRITKNIILKADRAFCLCPLFVHIDTGSPWVCCSLFVCHHAHDIMLAALRSQDTVDEVNEHEIDVPAVV